MSDDSTRLAILVKRFPFLPEWLSWMPGYYLKVDLIVKRFQLGDTSFHVHSDLSGVVMNKTHFQVIPHMIILVENHQTVSRLRPKEVPIAIKV